MTSQHSLPGPTWCFLRFRGSWNKLPAAVRFPLWRLRMPECLPSAEQEHLPNLGSAELESPQESSPCLDEHQTQASSPRAPSCQAAAPTSLATTEPAQTHPVLFPTKPKTKVETLGTPLMRHTCEPHSPVTPWTPHSNTVDLSGCRQSRKLGQDVGLSLQKRSALSRKTGAEILKSAGALGGGRCEHHLLSPCL